MKVRQNDEKWLANRTVLISGKTEGMLWAIYMHNSVPLLLGWDLTILCGQKLVRSRCKICQCHINNILQA